jgi:hypothetical protein
VIGDGISFSTKTSPYLLEATASKTGMVALRDEVRKQARPKRETLKAGGNAN